MAKVNRERSRRKRVCLLTGASGTLGNAFCERYKDTYEIAGVHHSHDLSVPTQFQQSVDLFSPESRLQENRHPVFAIEADLSDDEQLSRTVHLVLERFQRIDLLVNCASYSRMGPLLGTDDLLDSLGRQFQLHVYVPVKLSTVIARMFWNDVPAENRRLRRGIVNISSTSANVVYPGLGQAGYAACKAALNEITRHMAVEFNSIGIRVNAVAPNSFPRRVATERVAREIVKIDRMRISGEIRVVNLESR